MPCQSMQEQFHLMSRQSHKHPFVLSIFYIIDQINEAQFCEEEVFSQLIIGFIPERREQKDWILLFLLRVAFVVSRGLNIFRQQQERK